MTALLAGPSGPFAVLPGWSVIRLRRDGLPPLRFAGRLVARHGGRPASATLWHEYGLYRTVAAGYAAEIVAWAAQPEGPRPTRCHAMLFDTLDAALSGFEEHDAARDICPGLAAPELACRVTETPPAGLAMQAAALRVSCQDVTRRYRIGVGAFLAGIATADPVDGF